VETFLMLARASDAQGNGPRATLKDVADGLVEIWGRLIREKGLDFIYDSERAPTQLYNQTLLQSVMGNLLRNAWHYTDHGFIRLTLGEQGFSVEDSGIGIPDDKREAMFQPFVRGDQNRGVGLGLGLSLVQRICNTQQWRVTLSARQPNGCCFAVAFFVE
jgi:signal transduction histidine kinase